MSLHYLLDGYNIVKRIPALSRKELKAARHGLYRIIEARRPRAGSRNKITIIFDGKSEFSFPAESSAVGVVFSRDKSADEEIKTMVGACKNPACLVVVSDDRLLSLECRALGARIMSVNDFLKSDRGKARAIKEDNKDISFKAEYKINAELRKKWLKE
jgi:predicted RNA-binding protein with PIN domain